MAHTKKMPGRTCAYCNRPLKLTWHAAVSGPEARYGHAGEGLFCGPECGYEYGRNAALEAEKSHG